MRFRLVHQISALLLGTVALAVVAMGGLVAWNLRSGFSEYLRAQDAQFLDRVMLVAENDLRRHGGLPDGDLRERLHAWVDATAPRPQRQPGWALDEPADPPDGAEPAALPRPPRGLRRDQPPPPPRPPRDAANWGPRLLLLSLDGQLLAGRREMFYLPGQTRALKIEGRELALLRLAERVGGAEGVDARFLRRQYLGIGGVALALLLLALVAARLLARRWVRPLQQAQAAARRMAHGEFEVRIAQGERDDELAELTQDLNAMAASLQRLESGRRHWIAQLSHELRTPLAVLRGELEALADGVRPWDRRALQSLQDEVRRLSRLIDDFHTLACSDLRSLPCRFAELQPQALIEAAAERVQERARAAGLRLQLDLPAELPPVRWDADRIGQLLANLLENSLRYTDAPGQIVLRARRLGAMLIIDVEDSAPGLPPAALAQVFEPLYRAEASRSRASGGSGLGLTIALALARSHGGRLSAEASSLGGLRLRLELPIHPPEAMR
ncbi:ATP-binding protein [Paucibacter sp. APW11]|uniref:histidine kinase n=1 Tax=Roseateles aquae TaxID=3077235 RepID=A0ABU3PDT5_9BURK|nr:ATP-binding protein [Paucibacter sp. APW11]MDT9000708.1 ATP-binding protein [Paucibacter sp. APW11]